MKALALLSMLVLPVIQAAAVDFDGRESSAWKLPIFRATSFSGENAPPQATPVSDRQHTMGSCVNILPLQYGDSAVTYCQQNRSADFISCMNTQALTNRSRAFQVCIARSGNCGVPAPTPSRLSTCSTLLNLSFGNDALGYCQQNSTPDFVSCMSAQALTNPRNAFMVCRCRGGSQD